MPTVNLLKRYELEQFATVVESVKSVFVILFEITFLIRRYYSVTLDNIFWFYMNFRDGNLKKLDETLMENERFFVECGIFLMLEKLKIIAFRNLFKKV